MEACFVLSRLGFEGFSPPFHRPGDESAETTQVASGRARTGTQSKAKGQITKWESGPPGGPLPGKGLPPQALAPSSTSTHLGPPLSHPAQGLRPRKHPLDTASRAHSSPCFSKSLCGPSSLPTQPLLKAGMRLR